MGCGGGASPCGWRCVVVLARFSGSILTRRNCYSASWAKTKTNQQLNKETKMMTRGEFCSFGYDGTKHNQLWRVIRIPSRFAQYLHAAVMLKKSSYWNDATNREHGTQSACPQWRIVKPHIMTFNVNLQICVVSIRIENQLTNNPKTFAKEPSCR